jgi:hypothetical protein
MYFDGGRHDYTQADTGGGAPAAAWLASPPNLRRSRKAGLGWAAHRRHSHCAFRLPAAAASPSTGSSTAMAWAWRGCRRVPRPSTRRGSGTSASGSKPIHRRVLGHVRRWLRSAAGPRSGQSPHTGAQESSEKAAAADYRAQPGAAGTKRGREQPEVRGILPAEPGDVTPRPGLFAIHRHRHDASPPRDRFRRGGSILGAKHLHTRGAEAALGFRYRTARHQ